MLNDSVEMASYIRESLSYRLFIGHAGGACGLDLRQRRT